VWARYTPVANEACDGWGVWVANERAMRREYGRGWAMAKWACHLLPLTHVRSRMWRASARVGGGVGPFVHLQPRMKRAGCWILLRRFGWDGLHQAWAWYISSLEWTSAGDPNIHAFGAGFVSPVTARGSALFGAFGRSAAMSFVFLSAL